LVVEHNKNEDQVGEAFFTEAQAMVLEAQDLFNEKKSKKLERKKKQINK